MLDVVIEPQEGGGHGADFSVLITNAVMLWSPTSSLQIWYLNLPVCAALLWQPKKAHTALSTFSFMVMNVIWPLQRSYKPLWLISVSFKKKCSGRSNCVLLLSFLCFGLSGSYWMSLFLFAALALNALCLLMKGTPPCLPWLQVAGSKSFAQLHPHLRLTWEPSRVRCGASRSFLSTCHEWCKRQGWS